MLILASRILFSRIFCFIPSNGFALRLLFGLGPLLWCAAGWAANFNVTVEDNSYNSYSPSLLNISGGDTVIWKQNGGDHDVVADDGSFGSGDLIPFGLTYSFTFLQAGSFGYYCSLHGAPGSGMFGTINVSGTAANRPPATPVNQAPASGATNQPLATPLQASTFSDPDAGNSHAPASGSCGAFPTTRLSLTAERFRRAKQTSPLPADC